MSLLPEPYASLRPQPNWEIRGWAMTGGEEARLAHLVEHFQIRKAVELGSCYGHSSRVIAQALGSGGRLHCIDPWLADPQSQGVLAPPILHPVNVYQTFLSNMLHAGIADRVTPWRMHALEAYESLALEYELVFEDAEHSVQSTLLNLLTWERPDVLLAGHDYGWPSVNRAVTTAARKLMRPVHSLGQLWWMPPVTWTGAPVWWDA